MVMLMKLYKYSIFLDTFHKKVYEVIEKPKTYVTPDGRHRFKKIGMEAIQDVFYGKAFLTIFDDDERARKELTNFYKSERKRLDEIHERQVADNENKFNVLKEEPKVEERKPWN